LCGKGRVSVFDQELSSSESYCRLRHCNQLTRQPWHRLDLTFWLRWVAATTATTAVSWAARAFLGAFWHYESIIWWVVSGALVGSAQWLILRQCLPAIGWWILASAIGWGVGGALADSANQTIGGDARFFASSLVFGAAVAVPQWYVLHRRVARAFLWIPISLVGWSVASAAYLTIAAIVNTGILRSEGLGMLGMISALCCFAATTGAVPGVLLAVVVPHRASS
jgi:hypothetical protein